MATKSGRKVEIGLWTVQTVLALLFAFAGVMKLVIPAEALAQQSGMDPTFLKFIGVCETLGALGLILPGAFRIRQGLTGLAAAGLVIIMIGATVLTAADQGVPGALVPFVAGCLSSVIAWRRWPANTATQAQLVPASVSQ
jgi:uncharacterized membrane protein YphA (DoxX/SURF4 family)